MMSYATLQQGEGCCDDYHHQQQQQQQVDVIVAMNELETSGYVSRDYLQQQQQDCNDTTTSELAQQTNDAVPRPAAGAITPTDRYKMAEWCYTIADFCKFQRSSVSICMSYVDRYLAAVVMDSNKKTLDCVDFQLVVLAAFYTTVKIHEHEAISPEAVAALSRGLYSKDQIEKMEFQILQTIKWRVNPPTSFEYTQRLMNLVDTAAASTVKRSSQPQHVLDAILDLTKFQCELSVLYYDFVPVPASHLALAALINATESVGEQQQEGRGYNSIHQEYYWKIWSDAVCVDIKSKQFHDLRMRLYEAVYTKPTTGQISEQGLSTLVRVPTTTTTTSSVLPAVETKKTNEQQQQQDLSPRSVTRSSFQIAPPEAKSYSSSFVSMLLDAMAIEL